MSGILLALGAVTDVQCQRAMEGRPLTVQHMELKGFVFDDLVLLEKYGSRAQRRLLHEAQSADPEVETAIAAALHRHIVSLGRVKVVVMDEPIWLQWSEHASTDHDLTRTVTALCEACPGFDRWVVRSTGVLEYMA